MFDSLFPSHWSDLQKLMWLKILKGGTASYETISGNPVSFTARNAPLRQLSVAFSPVQDLHGYDSPWPAGGGKNLLYQMPTTSQTINGVAWSINADGSITANGTATGDSTFFYIPNTSGIGYSFDGDYKYKNFGYVSTSIMKIGVKIGDAWKTVYSNSYSDVSDVHGQIKQMWLQIRDGQTANNIAIYPLICKASETEPTAWTPYSNLCPILGWDSVTVEQRGKNLLDTAVVFDANHNYMVPNADGSVTVKLSNNTAWSDEMNVPIFLKAGKYVLKRSDTTGSCQVRKSTNNYGSNLVYISATETRGSFILTEDCYIKIKIQTSGTYPNTTFVWLNLLEDESEYVPYNPLSRSISITIGQTVYSGYVDVVTGVVTVDMAEVDMGTLIWAMVDTSSTGIYRVSTSSISGRIKRPPTSGTPINMICEAYAVGTADDTYLRRVKIGVNTGGLVSVYDPNYNAADPSNSPRRKSTALRVTMSSSLTQTVI